MTGIEMDDERMAALIQEKTKGKREVKLRDTVSYLGSHAPMRFCDL